MDEINLIALLKEGDSEAFSQLINHYRLSLMRICNGFLHNDEDSRDVVQEVFIEVFQSINSFRSDSRISTWIYRIAVNKSLNLLRKRRVNQLLQIASLSEKNFDSHNIIAAQSDRELENKERKQMLRRAIDKLPANQRIAFVLNKYLDLSYAEAAEVMGISISALESLLYRARENLQKTLLHFYKKKLI